MRLLKRVVLASLLTIAVGAFAASTTATACPGADKASTADQGE